MSRTLQSQNADIPGGRIDQGPQSITMRTRGRVETPEEFGELVVRQVDGHPVKVSDVARIDDGVAEPTTLANIDGAATVLLQIRKQSGTNTVEVVRNVKERLDDAAGGAAARLLAADRAQPGRLHRGVDPQRRGAPDRRVAARRASWC